MAYAPRLFPGVSEDSSVTNGCFPVSCPHCGAAVPEGGHCPSCSAPTFADDVASASTAPVPGPPPRGLGAFRVAPGQRFGDRYTLIEEIGAGGMGQVYKAIDGSLGKTVALKLVRARSGPPGADERALPPRADAGPGGHPPQRLPRLRPRRDRRHALHQHGVRRGPEPRRPHPVRRHALDQADDRARPADLRGPGGDPLAEDRPPRPQARQHHGRPRRPRHPDGLRPGLRARAGPADRRRRDPGHARLPLPGAGASASPPTRAPTSTRSGSSFSRC